MLPIIQSLWIGRDLSRLERLCIQSFMDHGHRFHLYVYDDIGNIPEGTVVKDADEILPRSAIFRNTNGSLGGFSDWFRYALLAKKGNFWVDMDTVCMRPFVFDSDVVFSYLDSYSSLFCASPLMFPKGHAVTVLMEYACRHYNEEMPWDGVGDRMRKRMRRILRKGRDRLPWGVPGGPSILTAAVRHLNLARCARPHSQFNPVQHESWACLFGQFSTDNVDFLQDAYVVHFYNEIGRRLEKRGFCTDSRFDDGSLFEQLNRKHGIPPVPGASRITSAELRRIIPFVTKLRQAPLATKIKHRVRAIKCPPASTP